MQQILGLWLAGTAVFLAGGFVWAFVPVLVPILGLTVAIGVLVAGIVALARGLERWRGGPRRPQEDGRPDAV